MRGRGFVAATMSGLILGLCAAAPAAALQPGVFINPGSPAGKEYAFPLSVLRAQGAGKSTPSQDRSEPLFGVGVGSRAGGAGPRTQSHGRVAGSSRARRRRRSSGALGSGGTGSSRGTTGGLAASGARGPLSSAAEASLARIAAPGSELGMMILLIVIVLVAGLGIGVGVRVLGRRS